MKRSWWFGVTLSAALLSGGLVQAATISIGLSGNGTPPAVADVTSSNFANLVAPSFGNFNNISVTGGAAGTNFSSTAFTLTASGPGSLYVFVTASGLTDPIGQTSFTSSFTSNVLPAGWTLQTQTFLDNGNGIFTQVDQLGDATFNGLGLNVDQDNAVVGPGEYSLTTLFIVTATGASTVQMLSTVNVDRFASDDPGQVPLPAAVFLFGSVLVGGAGLSAIRRRRKIAA